MRLLWRHSGNVPRNAVPYLILLSNSCTRISHIVVSGVYVHWQIFPFVLLLRQRTKAARVVEISGKGRAHFFVLIPHAYNTRIYQGLASGTRTGNVLNALVVHRDGQYCRATVLCDGEKPSRLKQYGRTSVKKIVPFSRRIPVWPRYRQNPTNSDIERRTRGTLYNIFMGVYK